MFYQTFSSSNPYQDFIEASSTDGTLLRGRPLLSFIDEFIAECSVADFWTISTIKAAQVLKSHLNRFAQAQSFDYFTREGLDYYIRYLRENARLREASCKKQYMNLRWFLSWAIRKGYCADRTVLDYKPRFKLIEQPVIFLSPKELSSLWHLAIPEDGTAVILRSFSGRCYTKRMKDSSSLEIARDLFCFCAFTSLRYSDMVTLKKTDIDGSIMKIVTKKTDRRLVIDLCPQALSILSKYSTKELPGERALPYLSNQRMNYLLKELCELAGINSPVRQVFYKAGKRQERVLPKWRRVTTHAARRTFVSYALSSGIPPQVVMKWTGHGEYGAMKPYIDVADSVRTEAMASLSRAWSQYF